ncbi:MAG TPA: enoyl-CoA hydratase-related protein [Dongiaceae bacterium]|jgi:methylglutaconyl-CoA hydratase|nr:enoyl-CoA hydratase-related protein [Dongiaceae bacterium]
MIHLEKSGPIARLTLDRPEKHNAFDEETIESLIGHLEDVAVDPTLRVLLLRATGASFCAGGDIAWMQRMARFSMEENRRDAGRLARLMHLLFTLPMPSIALVQGPAYGGGLGLVACCDFALAAPEARFCLSEVRIGLIPSVIAPYLLRALGPRLAQRLALSAEIFSAEQALAWQLIQAIHPKAELEVAASTLAEQLLANGPEAMRAAKKLLAELDPIDERERAMTVERIAAQRASREGQEGLAAFLEKRPPHWRRDVR